MWTLLGNSEETMQATNLVDLSNPRRPDSFACPYPPCKFITAQLRYMVRHVDNIHKGSPTKSGEVGTFYCCDCSFSSKSQVRSRTINVRFLSYTAMDLKFDREMLINKSKLDQFL